MLDTFRKLYDLLDTRERRNAVLLFGMMLVMGLLQAIGVASVMPFIAVVANPEAIHTNTYLAAAYQAFGFTSTDSFLLFLGIATFVLIVSSLAFQALTQWAIARFTHMRNYSLSCRLLHSYLSRPYSFFLNHHSADMGKTVLFEVGQVITQVLIPSVQLVASAVVAAFLIALVILVEPVVALAAVLLLGSAYTLIYAGLRKRLSRIGDDRYHANTERFQIAQEAFGGIKEVKILGLEENYLGSFRQPANRFARHQATNQIISELPQFVLQALVIGAMLLLLLALLATHDGNLSTVLPLMGLYAFAGNRLRPALQKIYKSLTQVRFSKPALDALHRDLTAPGAADLSTKYHTELPDPAPILLRERLELRNIRYTYPQADSPALDNLSLTIQAKTTVALVGSTGAGKTTAVDLILGLLSPQEGEIKVDGTPITQANARAWQKSLGYVPQHIFLTDDTVRANIAFGVPEEKTDQLAVERAARIAELHDFVVNDMPQGYDTMVGERGVRLSGGQRQRIGIARALYHDPDVLILDEATSALDNLTEKAVMDAVHNLGHRKTIILIAHRLSTVRQCDCIFMLENGQLTASGTYDQLLERSNSFKVMAVQSGH